MKKFRIFIKWVLILVCCAFAGMAANDSSAALTPINPFQAEALPDPNPPAFDYSSSIAYYNNYLIYAGEDGKIYGYNLDSSASVVISDTSLLGEGKVAVQGFFVSSDDYLYFHDNAANMAGPQSIYRLQLSGNWPVDDYETLVTNAVSAIFAFTENPWTNRIWFSSSDFFGSGNNFYLYQVDADFKDVTLQGTFKQPNGGGNGPIIFEDESTLLYGEAVFGGNGYFHRVNTTTGTVFQANYLTFSGGLGDSTYGYNNRIFATSGGGKEIFELRGVSAVPAVGTTDGEARGLTFNDANFYVSEMVPFSGAVGADDGKISLNKASLAPQPSSSGGGGGGGCFIDSMCPGALTQSHVHAYLLFFAVVCLGTGIFVRLRRG